MYKHPITGPKKFGRSEFGSNKNFKRSNNRPKKRGFSERIDFSRFVKKGQHIKEKPYVSKHTFSDFPFHSQVHKNIARAGFIHPRPIQDQAIPSILKGLGIFSVACVGGLPIMKQIVELRKGVSFVIGTPGRMRDLIERKVLDLSTYHKIVLDEADRMLDMGFRDDMIFILSKVPKENRQTLFFSATLSAEVKKLTTEFLKGPVFISVVSGETAKNIDQDVIRTRSKEEKLEKLHEVLKREGSNKVLIFREMKHSVDTLTKDLAHMGFKVGCIHGDKRSRERIRTLDLFKKNHISILIATDVAARGLDIPDVTHVINYDIPQTYDTYVHRIGRTGRSGKKGIALTFV